MREKQVGLTVLGVLVSILLTFGLGWATSPPTLLVVVRASDDSLWKMTCDELACSPFTSFPGMFHYQPTLTWDQTAQEWVIVGTASDNTIWMATFDKQGNFNNDWHSLSGNTPSPVAVAGGPLQPVTITVDCPGQSLQVAVDAAQPGDVIKVSGTCTENVVIPPEKQRLTLNGQNVGTLQALSPSNQVLDVKGKGIMIKNFVIMGGLGVRVERGATATIEHNNISNAGDKHNGGITVQSSAFAVITNNNIHDNPGDGILVNDTATVRIGFDRTSDSSPSPNTIQNNGGRGITVIRSSNARIVGNTIVSNTGNGILVVRLSQADIAGNTINNNGASGINVGHNAGVQLGEDNPATFFDQPNITTVNNVGYGINCSLGAYVRGHLGSSNQINGTLAQTNIDTTCPNSLVTP
jgi:parallel beta-helix repeat protein